MGRTPSGWARDDIVTGLHSRSPCPAEEGDGALQMQTADVASRRVHKSHQKMFTKAVWTELWVGPQGRRRLPASSESGKLLPLRDRRDTRRPGWTLRRGPGEAVHTARSLPGSCLNHPHCLPLGEPHQKSEGKPNPKESSRHGLRDSASGRRADSGFVVEVKAADREKRAAKGTHVVGSHLFARRCARHDGQAPSAVPKSVAHCKYLGALTGARSAPRSLWGLVPSTRVL